MEIYRRANLVAGKWQVEGSGDALKVLHKYTGEEIASIPQATEQQMEEAIVAANAAFKTTKSWSAGKKMQMMQKLYDKLEEQKEKFVDLIIEEGGKPRWYAENEISRCLTTLELGLEEAIRLSGEMVPIDFNNGEGKTAFTLREPIGVIACITPFNFPLNLVMHKVAPALATGCTVVVKPAPQAPLSCLAFAKLFEEVGYPAGVINVLCCDIPVAEKLVRDERVAKLSFTGSDKVGWYLKSIAGKKKVTLELGGNAAILVDKDSNIDEIVDLIALGSFLYAGQICISTQRIFVHQEIYDDFEAQFIQATQRLKVGDPNDGDTRVGPVIDAGHLSRIEDWVKESEEQGARVLLGGGIQSKENNLFEPTIITDTSSSMKVCSEEIFGPVATLEKVESFQAGIAALNDSKYGLQAGVFTNSMQNFKTAVKELEVGGVMMNNIPGFRIDNMPYGGVKDSGLGREGLKYAMEEMTEAKLVIF